MTTKHEYADVFCDRFGEPATARVLDEQRFCDLCGSTDHEDLEPTWAKPTATVVAAYDEEGSVQIVYGPFGSRPAAEHWGRKCLGRNSIRWDAAEIVPT